MKQSCLLLLLIVGLGARSQVYFHDFGITPVSAHPYVAAPAIIHPNLSASSWSNSTGAWTSFTGSSGEAIALSNSGGTPTVTLTLSIASGYNLNITSFDFWRQRSATGAQNWSMTINGIVAGAGSIPTTGSAIGTTTVSNPVNNLTGTVTIILSLSGASGAGTFRLDDFTLNGNVLPNAFVLLDNFNRNDTIRPAIPSSGGSAWWVEQEPGICFSGSALEKIRIKNNMLELSSCTYSNSSCLVSPTQATSMNMTGKYPVVFSTAASTMEWYFNMQQTRADPNGFEGGQYGAAFVIGSNTNDPLASSKTGYAVIYGEAGTTDPIRLVSFNGSVFNTTTFTNILSVPSPATKTNAMSVKVTYNPCNSLWTLTVRDDGASFADPSTVTGIGASGVNSTFTSTSLLWLGQVWNHGSSCSLARFDNIYIPSAVAATGAYTWTGIAGTDFQSPWNWSPFRQCVKMTDKLVFNNTSPASSVVTNIPTQTIGQLTVSNNRIVTLSDIAGDAVVATLTIAGSAGTDLQVDAGSVLNFDGTSAAAGDALEVVLAAGATASISGTVSFNSTPGGTRPHRLLGTDASSIVVNNGGKIRAMELSGNPFGTTLPQHTVIFNSGAAYECYSGANPFGLSQPDSKVLFNSGSIYRHNSVNQPSVLGRVYADFEAYSNVNINSGGAASMTVNNLKVISGTTQFTGVLNNQPVNMNIKGDLLVSPGATLSYDPAVTSVISFSSTTNAQKINNTGTLTFGLYLTVRLNSSFGTAPQLTVETDVVIPGILEIMQGTLKLTGNITLKSTIDGTASVAPITGAISYGAGRFVVERYIPLHNKAWQFLAIPSTGQTVNAAWQEGNAPLVAGTAGLGTIITSNTPGTGFDIIGGGGPSMKTYDTTGAGSWKGISRTDTAIYNRKGYMLFVRGDRTVTTTAAAPTATTLRTTGMIFDPAVNPPPVTTIGAGKFESIGNPYASAIDFSNDLAVIKSANVQKVFYVWDPKLGTTYGGYQTFIKGAGADYTVIPGGGSYPAAGTVQNLVQSGQAFFVRAMGGTGTVSFTENAKVSGSSLVTRVANGTGYPVKSLRTELHVISNNNSILLDAVLNEFGRDYSDSVDMLDALKMDNVNESVGLKCGPQLLSVERRTEIRTRDTIYYRLDKLMTGQYELVFSPGNIDRPGLNAFLTDRYLGEQTQLSLTGTSSKVFQVTSDPASANPGRFFLVFKKKQAARSDAPEVENDDQHIAIYPNPVLGNTMQVNFINMAAGKYRVQLLTASGQVIVERLVAVNSKRQLCPITLPFPLSGNYRLLVTSPDGFRFTKQIMVSKS